MPPNPLQRKALSQETPSLSDEDVGLLYQVITCAEQKQEHKQLPFRALFAAYDEVIAEHAVDADPSHACLRFLFKMGNKDVRGDTLYDKFENVLQQMGIVLDFGDDDDSHGNKTHEYQNSIDGWHTDNVTGTLPQEDTTQRTRRRRASFNSMYDVGEDATQRSFANRPSSRSSLSRLQTGKPKFSEPRESLGRAANNNVPDFTDRTQLIAQFLDVGRRLINRMGQPKLEKDKADEAPPTNGRHARSAVDRDRSKRMVEASRTGNSWSSASSNDGDADGDGDGDDDEGSSEPSQVDNNIVEKHQPPPEMLYRPSLSDLLRDASTFNMYRQRAISRRILTQWLKKAVQVQQTHQNMEVVAVNRDWNTLVRQGFQSWRSIIQGKRQTARTERFFKHLEQRAGRARDLYLVTKAFTHWAQISADEVAKTNAARRHVLGVKYFNAWRDITAVNELKAQRFSLRRPFNAWRKKAQQVKEIESTAVAVQNTNLRHAVYWQWFWSFCDRRAPQWYDYRLKRRALLYWLRKFRTNRERNHEIELKNKRFTLGSALQMWSQRSKAITAAEQEATAMQRQQLLNETYEEWKIKFQLAPAAIRVSGLVDKRVLQTTFKQWTLRLQMVQASREMDQLRVMRNSWTAWNDLLRCQALSARIEERLKMETMYKWILAERYRLMQRIRGQRIKREVFSIFVTNVRTTYTRLLHHADMHEDHRSGELLRAKFSDWREQLYLQRQRESIAVEDFYAPRLQKESMTAWKSKHQHVTKMEGWAQDARFYFLATRFVKGWHVATLESAKRRRQDAYAKTRRKMKVNIATKAMTSWQSKARHVLDMEQQARDFHRKRTLGSASELVMQWHDQTSKRMQDCEEADIYYSRQVAYEQLMRWTEAFIDTRDLEQQASGIYRVHVLKQANIQLRKLSLRIFQLKSTDETAEALKERNLRKHSRTMFRHWLDKARIQFESRDSPGPLVTPARNFDGAGGMGSDRTVFDPWPQTNTTPFRFNNFPTQGPSTTPLTTPNFLTSPSKRAARTKAIEQVSTTPATPLQTPFASRLLRAGVMAGRTASTTRRGRNGRGSSLGTSVRFVDEEPESPTDGRKSANRRM
ncbi:hypothetical protein ASPWEDRAFT_27785 [Aspergillus wentii DTO 134E9]|uniref:Sfi1 spindle body domain-containing protein n=1 Tax=Aspergillus wentii DTO 134E9 TaxID=1073089 RepID=A0A1L9RJK7_ASPWE|nr:uncharacterized protein ASPWEDRAFT_27785 [Aspergillus wentii DTO 134E9]OJJ35112.1 hypothetical protein ASPWEDRAFT_27785 [Aspergillus wentii DTO 134E9]